MIEGLNTNEWTRIMKLIKKSRLEQLEAINSIITTETIKRKGQW